VTPKPLWLLLVHSVPPKPPYLRAKVMRRLAAIGALPLKRSAYLLPNDDQTVEDFQWLQREIQQDGGDAWVVEARFISGLRDDAIRERFRDSRAADYRVVVSHARELLERVGSADDDDPSADVERRRLTRRLDAIRRVDFFLADGREEAEGVMAAVQRGGKKGPDRASATLTPAQLRGRTWMTRRGVKVDRMASAWLITRFIDPAATFVFAAPDRQTAAGDVIRFDMFEGEFTHDGSRCTFEVLLDVVNRPADRGLAALGQIVHDLDVRDERYQRAETAGVGAMIAGVVAGWETDAERLAASRPLLDALYASLGGQPLPPSKEQP
jgi:hypothetical protein